MTSTLPTTDNKKDAVLNVIYNMAVLAKLINDEKLLADLRGEGLGELGLDKDTGLLDVRESSFSLPQIREKSSVEVSNLLVNALNYLYAYETARINHVFEEMVFENTVSWAITKNMQENTNKHSFATSQRIAKQALATLLSTPVIVVEAENIDNIILYSEALLVGEKVIKDVSEEYNTPTDLLVSMNIRPVAYYSPVLFKDNKKTQNALQTVLDNLVGSIARSHLVVFTNDFFEVITYVEDEESGSYIPVKIVGLEKTIVQQAREQWERQE